MARSKCMQIKIFLRSYLFLFRVIRVKDQAVENSDPASYLCYCGLNMYSDFKVSALFLIFVTCIFTWHGEGILILFIVADKNLEKHCNAAIKLHHRVCIYVYPYGVCKNKKEHTMHTPNFARYYNIWSVAEIRRLLVL